MSRRPATSPLAPNPAALPRQNVSGKKAARSRQQRRIAESDYGLPPDFKYSVMELGKKAQHAFSKELEREPVFAGRAGTLFAACLRPDRPKGRKPIAAVSQAIRMLRSRRLKSVEASKRWAKIYPKVIANWDNLSPDERADKSSRLRNQAQSRLRIQRTRAKRVRA